MQALNMNMTHELALLRKDLETAVSLLRKDVDLVVERLEHRLERRINRAKMVTITWIVGTVLLAQVAGHFWR